MNKLLVSLAAGVFSVGFGLSAHAVPIVLDFEGIGDNAQILEFYNGGTDSQGNSGTNYGVSFSDASFGFIDADAGGSGNFANEPSPDTAMTFLDSTGAILNFAAGFDTGFSFFYSSVDAVSVSVFEGLDASGTLLGSIDLLAQGSDNCVGDPTGSLFCNWTAIGVAFAGTAQSIDFGGTANLVGYDNVTLGRDIPGGGENGQVPAPATLTLFGLGLAGLGWSRRKKV